MLEGDKRRRTLPSTTRLEPIVSTYSAYTERFGRISGLPCYLCGAAAIFQHEDRVSVSPLRTYL